MNEPLERELAVFSDARKLPARERGGFLDAACAGDAGLRQRVEELLQAGEEAGDFLAGPAARLTQAGGPIRPTVPPAEKAGDWIGRYKLVQVIGEGGCGVVYLAEQEVPVRRPVALKVIKLGMDTKSVIARFEAERQALALMDHPNIAKVLDAGATEAGRPYFVMELVRGSKITEYCDQHNLTTQERLDLFMQVCRAVQHAHQKGIIHRDLKPSNILVTMNDGVAVPKVIDFGIAKATQGKLTDHTVFTAFEQLLGTPAYMSPEQAELSAVDIDTRSDIYALGVLLYELLTGQTPFDARKLLQAGLDEIRRTIREVEPARPSTRLSTLLGADLTVIAKSRNVEPLRLIHLVRGDLDWIVMKCLEKDRTRRYDTANGLAADIQRHLSNEPVEACPPGTFYKFQKFARRNQFAFAAGAAIAMALLLGIVTSTTMAIRATRAKQAAQAAQAGELVQRQEAEAAELVARQQAYSSDMHGVQQALAENNFGYAVDLLNRQRPPPGKADLRGWEWRYLWQQSRGDAQCILSQQPSSIDSLAISPDGHWLAISDQSDMPRWDSNGFSIWDLPKRREVVRLAKGERHIQVAFSPAEPLLAYTGSVSNNPQWHCALHLWNIKARHMLAEIPMEDNICKALAFSSDGRVLATLTEHFDGHTLRPGHITLWSMPAGIKLANYSAEVCIKLNWDAGFATTQDLGLAAYCTWDGLIQVMDLHDGRLLWSTPAKPYAFALAFSPDSKVLATAEDATIRMLETASGRELGRLEDPSNGVWSLAFWPDGKKLASSSTDKSIIIWDVFSRTKLDVMHGDRSGVLRMALLPDGKTLVSGSEDGTVYLWDVSHPHPRQPHITIPEYVDNWCFAPDSQSVLTYGERGHLTRWTGATFQTPEPIMDLGSNYDYPVYGSSAFSPGGRLLATGSDKGILRVWDLAHRVLLRQITNTTFTNTINYLYPIKFLADGSRLLCGSRSDYLYHEWDLGTGRELQSWPQNIDLPNAQNIDLPNILLARDEHLWVQLGNEKQIFFRDLNTGQTSRINLNFFDPWAAAFSPGGQIFVLACYDYVRVWDKASWRELATLDSPYDNIIFYSLDFSQDGRRLIVGGNRQQTVSVWDTSGWLNVLTLAAKSQSDPKQTAFSPDGNTIGSLADDGILDLWRAPSWAEIKAAEAKDPPMPPGNDRGQGE